MRVLIIVALSLAAGWALTSSAPLEDTWTIETVTLDYAAGVVLFETRSNADPSRRRIVRFQGDASRRLLAIVHERRDFGIRVYPDKSAAKLVALADSDQPGVILRPAMTGRQQLLQHDRDLDAIGRA